MEKSYRVRRCDQADVMFRADADSEELERVVVAQEDSTFPSVSEVRLATYRQETPMWIRYASSVDDQLGPKPRIDVTLTGNLKGSHGNAGGSKHFLRTMNSDVSKAEMKLSAEAVHPNSTQPNATAKARQIRGSKIRKVEDAFF